jgi:hypothetical protein
MVKVHLGAEHSFAHLNDMKKLATGGHGKCSPNKFTYIIHKAIISFWSKSGHPEDANSIVQRLHHERSRLKK